METEIIRLKSLFKGREDSYTLGEPTDKIEGNNKKVFQMSTVLGFVELINFRNHLDGFRMLGISPLSEQGGVKFVCLDVDEYKTEDAYIEISRKLYEIDKIGKYLFPCLSKSNGLHIYLFFDYEIRKEGLNRVSNLIDYVLNKVEFQKVEIFPRYFIQKENAGNTIGLPYFNREECCCVYNGNKLNLNSFLNLAEKTLIGDEILNYDFEKENEIFGLYVKKDYQDCPPCLNFFLKKGVEEGCRTDVLFSFGVYLRNKFKEDFGEHLFEINKSICSEPLPPNEISNIINSLKKGKYSYKCNSLALSEHCDKKRCRRVNNSNALLSPPYKLTKKISKSRFIRSEPSFEFEFENDFLNVSIETLMNEKKFKEAYYKYCISLEFPFSNLPSAINERGRSVKMSWEEYVETIILPTARLEYLENNKSIESEIMNFIICYLMRSTRNLDWMTRGQPYLTEDEKYYCFDFNFLLKKVSEHFREIKINRSDFSSYLHENKFEEYILLIGDIQYPCMRVSSEITKVVRMIRDISNLSILKKIKSKEIKEIEYEKE